MCRRHRQGSASACFTAQATREVRLDGHDAVDSAARPRIGASACGRVRSPGTRPPAPTLSRSASTTVEPGRCRTVVCLWSAQDVSLSAFSPALTGLPEQALGHFGIHPVLSERMVNHTRTCTWQQ